MQSTYRKITAIEKLLLIFLFSLVSSQINNVRSQSINGPSTANVNDVDQYTVYINDILVFYNWSVSGGTTQNISEQSVQITWTTAGTNLIEYDADGYYDWYYTTKNVTVSST